MSWNPNQGQNPHQGSNYGQPQNPYQSSNYDPPQNPYQGSNYGQPQNPQDIPPHPYLAPPPPHNPSYPFNYPPTYDVSATYIKPHVHSPSPATTTSQPPREAARDLPKQYINVITHPSEEIFIAEQDKADWAMILIQLVGLGLITALFGSIRALLVSIVANTPINSTGVFGTFADLIVTTSATSAIFSILYIPLLFFIGAGIQFLLAKAFKGKGTFLVQSYTQLSYKVPLDIVGKLIYTIFAFIPIISVFMSPIVYLILLVYSVILNVFQIKAVHGLSGGKAIAVVLIPYGLALIFFLIVLAIASSYILSVLHLY